MENRLSIRTLARVTNVSDRTIRRDIDDLLGTLDDPIADLVRLAIRRGNNRG